VIYEKSTEIDHPQSELFDYHARPGAIDRLIPPWERVKIVRRGRSIEPGAEVLIANKMGPISLHWLARHTILDPPNHFRDIQVYGPFRSWVHDHRLESLSASRSKLTDSVDYELPFGPLGALGKGFVRKKLESMFSYRHQVTRFDLDLRRSLLAPSGNGPQRPIRVAISGSTGMIGQRICSLATVLGIQVVRICRPKTRPDDAGDLPLPRVVLDGSEWLAGKEHVEDLDAVIHLGGHGIADGRWTTTTKSKILESRVRSTEGLVRALSKLANPPKRFVCASGLGVYGDRGEAIMDENSQPESRLGRSPISFLGQVSEAWEQAARGFESFGPVAIGRLGIVLDTRQGALAKMLPIFRFCLGGPLGSGKQYWSWIHIDDASASFLHLAIRPDVGGVYNLCAPDCPTNREFTRTLARAINRFAVLPAPSWGLRTVLGQMADELLLASTRAVPTRLIEGSFAFRYPQLEAALRSLV
jgi:uncharacterized protein